MFNKFWTYISHVGISGDTTPSEAKRFILTNQFMILSIFITAGYSFFFGCLGYSTAVISGMFFILTYFILWLISREKYTKLARLLFIIIANFQIYIACLIFGEASQLYTAYIPVVAIPIVLYDYKQKNFIFVFILFTIALVSNLFKINFASALSITISPEAIHLFKLSSNILVIVCELILVYAFVIGSYMVEQKLGSTNVSLEDQFQTIFNNSSDALFLVDYETKLILKANNRAIELFEMNREADFFSHMGSDFHKHKMKDHYSAYITNQLIQKGFFEDEMEYTTIRGKEFWGSYAIRKFSLNGKMFHTIRITDITENKKTQELIEASLHEKKVLLAEIHHRVKNNLAVISGLLGLQASHIDDEKVKGLFDESRNRIHSMALIHEKLYQNETFAKIQLDSYISDLVNNIKQFYKAPDTDIDFIVSTNDTALDIKYAVPCGLILNELITNACKHAFKERKAGEIKIEFTKVENTLTMMVSDDGIGYDAETLLKKSDTLGLTLINALTDQIDGKLTTTSDKGTTYQISFEV